MTSRSETAPTDAPRTPDFEIAGHACPEDAVALQGLLAEHADRQRGLRLCGAGSQLRALPTPAGDAPPTLVSLRALDRILRLDPDDLTCSVEPGVRLPDLAAALREHGLCLPCPPAGATTLGGLFAAGRSLPEAPGALGARHLLLGLGGVLAEGRAFKSGARVVKSVAGFDLQKVFVGNRGRLFAATELHLKLRPLPATTAGFALDATAAVPALDAWRRLRRAAQPPSRLELVGDAGHGYLVRGVLTGHPRVVDRVCREHGLTPTEAHPTAPWFTEDVPAGELLVGAVRPGRAAALLDLLEAAERVRLTGNGEFELATANPARSDQLLTHLAALDAVAEIARGTPDRRGRATPGDPVADRLEATLRSRLDPHEVLR